MIIWCYERRTNKMPGGNLYKNWGPEQRQHWNEYNKKYAKTHFKTVNLKLRVNEDKDIIDFLNSRGGVSLSEFIRNIIREKIN